MRDPRIKRPCPVCGEGLHLTFQTDATHFPLLEGNDTVKDESGYDMENPVDAISCAVCHAHVPAVVWNREVSAAEYAVRRAFEVEDGKCGCGHEHYALGVVQEAA